MARLLKSHGLAMIDPAWKRAYIPIAKNASNSMTKALVEQGWQHVHLPNQDYNIREVIVVLRDPVQRWVSGISQYLRTVILSPVGPNGPVFDPALATAHDYHMTPQKFCDLYNDLVERLVFSQLDRFDDHVWPQCDFIPTLPGARKSFVLMDHEFQSSIANLLAIDLPDLNSSEHDPQLHMLQQWFCQRLLLRPELVQRIRDRYNQDYNLIREVHAN